jgi:ribosomal protein L1
MASKKQKIKKLVKEMLIESHKKALKSVDRALNLSCVDVDGWDEKIAPMILPKTILTAILEEESIQYTARGTTYEKRIKAKVKNIRYFL